MKKNFTILMLLAFSCLGLNAKTIEVTDVIDGDKVLATDPYKTTNEYHYFSNLEGKSGAIYDIHCTVRSADKVIRLDYKDSETAHGLVTKVSPGKAKSVTFYYDTDKCYYEYTIIEVDGKGSAYSEVNDVLTDGYMLDYARWGGESYYTYDFEDEKFIAFFGYGTYIYLKKIEIVWEVEVEETPVVVGPSGISSYCSEYPRDFAGTGVTAYVATGIEGTSVILEEITKVPRGVGVIVMGDPGTYTVPDIKEADEPEANFLVGVNKATDIKYRNDENGFINYVLLRHKETGDVAFHPLTSENDYTYTVLAGKSYLSIPASLGVYIKNLPLKLDVDGEEVTGIEAVNYEEVESGDAYNVQGIKVDSNYKGFVIKNGKKFYNR